MQPVTFTPYPSASRTACMPANAGSSEGWVLTKRPPKRSRKSRPTSFMNPAEMTRSGWYRSHDRARARSHAARVGWSATWWVKTGIPARRARASPSIPVRSAPTATTAAP